MENEAAAGGGEGEVVLFWYAPRKAEAGPDYKGGMMAKRGMAPRGPSEITPARTCRF